MITKSGESIGGSDVGEALVGLFQLGGESFLFGQQCFKSADSHLKVAVEVEQACVGIADQFVEDLIGS